MVNFRLPGMVSEELILGKLMGASLQDRLLVIVAFYPDIRLQIRVLVDGNELAHEQLVRAFLLPHLAELVDLGLREGLAHHR